MFNFLLGINSLSQVFSVSGAPTDDFETDTEIVYLPLTILMRHPYLHHPDHSYPTENTPRDDTALRILRYQPEERLAIEKRQIALIADEGLKSRMIRSRRSQEHRNNNGYGSALLWRQDRSAPGQDVRANSLLRSL